MNDNMIWIESKDADEYIWRYDGNPLFDVKETNDFWRVYNSSVIMKDGEYIGVFRCDDRCGKPDLHVGKSKDSVNWDINPMPIVLLEDDGTPFTYSYAYDPRIIEIENVYYIVFCADVDGPSIYIAKTTDFVNFEKIPSGFLPFNRNGVLFPEKINGMFLMLSRPCDSGQSMSSSIYLSESPDLIHWGNHKLLMKNFNQASAFWERIKIGAGPAPIKTKEGWLLIYHGVQNTCRGFHYSFGVALLDLENPSKVIYRSKRFLMAPFKEYEIKGFVPNVLFPCSAITNSKGQVTIYYGVADTNMGIAFTTIDKLLEFVKKYN